MSRISEWSSVTSGVPQGSVLARLLFIMYVNDLKPRNEHSKILKFADDTKLFSASSSPCDVRELQDNLQAFETWFDTRKMPVNTKKCGVLKFSKSSDQNANFVYKMHTASLSQKLFKRDLRVIISSDLNYKAHISLYKRH